MVERTLGETERLTARPANLPRLTASSGLPARPLKTAESIGMRRSTSIRTPSIVIASQQRQNDAAAFATVTHAFSPHERQTWRSSSLTQANMSAFEGTSRRIGRRKYDRLGASNGGIRRSSRGMCGGCKHVGSRCRLRTAGTCNR
jgi:hypothetical protein